MKDESLYLQHILAAIGKIEGYLGQADEAKFLREELLQDGVIRQLEIIGEPRPDFPQNCERNTRTFPGAASQE